LRSLPAVLVLGVIMAVAQYLLATNGLWMLGATGSAMVGLLGGLALTRLPFYRVGLADGVKTDGVKTDGGKGDGKTRVPQRSLLISLSGYAVLVALTFGINLITPLRELLDTVQLVLRFPALTTTTGFTTPAGIGRSINIFGHPGAVLLYSSLIAFFIYKRAGYYSAGAEARIANKVLKGAITSSLGIVSMVGLAVIMSHTGMTNLLAQGLSQGVGRTFYPLAAPFIGALGAFITGSNNNSNVLFALLQMRTAELLQISVPLILGAQTAGGSLGSVMAPAKVIVGCSTVGLGDQEGVVMGPVLVYGMVPVVVVAVVALIMAGG
jgi:lactate permease